MTPWGVCHVRGLRCRRLGLRGVLLWNFGPSASSVAADSPIRHRQEEDLCAYP